MTSTTETGHARNIAHFQLLINYCTALGSTYAPSRPDLALPALATLHTESRQALLQVHSNKAAYDIAVNNRQETFKNLKTLSTRLTNAIAVCGALSQTIEDAKSINKKIQGGGKKAKTIINPADLSVKTSSTSQQSYDLLTDHFTRYIELLKKEPHYNPNEPDLQPTALTILLQHLQLANTSVIETFTALSNTRLHRNEILYSHSIGLVSVAAAVKKYIKSIFGADSDEYRQIDDIEFKNIKTGN